jgi:hydrogenase maturation factor
MSNGKKKYVLGKIKHELLSKLLKDYTSGLSDDRVIMGSKIGEDAAVIDMGDKYLVAKTDPITFVTDEIGYYAVNINVNDVACTGAIPKWFQSTILLPEKDTEEELIRSIFNNIHETCKSMNIAVIGGHTEVTAGLDRPIVVGSLLGEVEKDSLVSTSGTKPGDVLILTKGIFIEGTSIIGREKEQYLFEKGYDSDFVKRCKNYLFDPGISVLKDALLANEHFKISAMHDPTEGGLLTGIAEMAIASDNGVEILEKEIHILPEPLELSKIFKLNPLNTISSGSLLIAMDKKESPEYIDLLKKNGINAAEIGYFQPKQAGLVIKDKNGKKSKMIYSEIDEITKIF